MKRVRQLVGPQAGQIVEMPFAVAGACLVAGTAQEPDKDVRIPGRVISSDPAALGRNEDDTKPSGDEGDAGKDASKAEDLTSDPDSGGGDDVSHAQPKTAPQPKASKK